MTNPFLKIILTLLITIHACLAMAQIQFELIPPPPPSPQIIADFSQVDAGSIAFADIDGDGDLDVLITGDRSDSLITKLYVNDGNGNFTEVSNTPFEGVAGSSIAFADVDGDGDQDVLITGQDNSNVRIAKLYLNDGEGNFTEVSETPFEGVYFGSIAFADVDGDEDQDVLITGWNNSNVPIAKLYTNDGDGSFTEVSETPFEGVNASSIAFTDVDGDGNQDVMITGENSSNVRIAKLYTNDGQGNFTEVVETPFEGVYWSSIAFKDIDGNDHQDLIITGLNSSNVRIAKLYTNDGQGNFTEVMDTPFEGVDFGSIAFADVDGDGYQDIMITGMSFIGSISKLYTNDGDGNFTEVMDTPFDGVRNSSVAFSDVNGNGDPDVLISGTSLLGRVTTLYINDGGGGFNEVSNSPFEGVSAGSIAFADVDGDNDQDVLITGTSLMGRISKLYINDGGGHYTEVSETPFDGVTLSSIAFADVDGDGDQDVLITGLNSLNIRRSRLYINEGDGNFTEVSGTPFQAVQQGSVAFADLDGDEDLDVLITGLNNSNVRIAKLYTNDGDGNFTEVIDTPFDGVNFSAIAFADVDGDGNHDVLITGQNNSNVRIAKLYLNDGDGNFTEVIDTPFDGVNFSAIAFNDVDGDGNQDVLISGQNSSNVYITKLYLNDGQGNFTEASDTPFEGVDNGSIAFADVDGDGVQDLLITGRNNSSVPISKLYTNDGQGNFTEVMNLSLDGVIESSVAFEDVDGDGLQDILITGGNSAGGHIAKLYRNTTCIPSSTTTTISSCTDYTWDANNETYTESGTYTFMDDCITKELVLTITESTLNSTTESACESFTWELNDETYTESGTYTFVDECHTEELVLTITEPTLNSTTESACESFTWELNDETYTESGTYTFEDDCHTEELILTITETTLNSTIESACESFTWEINDETYTESGTYSFEDGCHTEELVLTITETTLNSTTVSACESFTWEINDETYTESGTYTFEDGCHTEELVLSIHSLEEIDLLLEEASISVDIENATFQWLDCNDDFSPIEGATASLFSPSESGTYAVEVSQNECVQRSACVDFIVLSHEFSANERFKVFPNPTQSLLYLNVPDSWNGKTISLINATGQLIKSQIIHTTEMEIEMKALPSGLYFIQLNSEKGLINKRIVKY